MTERGLPGPSRPSAELSALADTMRSLQPALLTSTLEDQRASVEALAGLWPVADDVEIVAADIAGVPCERVTAPGAARRLVVHFHGGGYVIGSSITHRALAARLSREAEATVVVPSYRLAPEHRFPAAVEDAVAVYRAALQEVGDARRLAVSGDSAGGGLALTTLLAARAEGLTTAAAAVVCWSPWVDLGAESLPGSAPGGAPDPVLSPQWLDQAAAQYAGDGDRSHPLVSPLRADLGGLPPLLVMVGEVELLCPQGQRLAEVAREAGLEVEIEVYPGAVHWWMVFAPDAPESRASLRQAGAFIRSRTP